MHYRIERPRMSRAASILDAALKSFATDKKYAGDLRGWDSHAASREVRHARRRTGAAKLYAQRRRRSYTASNSFHVRPWRPCVCPVFLT